MNKKFRKQFHKEFPWYDYSFLLEAMLLWCEKASERHKKHGHLLRSDDTSRKLKLVSELLKRLITDDYDEPCRVFTNKNDVIKSAEWKQFNLSEDIVCMSAKHCINQRKQDKQLLFKLLEKHLDSFWD